MTICPELLDELLSGMKRPEDLPGDVGLLKELNIRRMDWMHGAGRHVHPGHEERESAPPQQSNRHKGITEP